MRWVTPGILPATDFIFWSYKGKEQSSSLNFNLVKEDAAGTQALFLMLALVMLTKNVLCKIVGKIANRGVNVVCLILRVVVFNK